MQEIIAYCDASSNVLQDFRVEFGNLMRTLRHMQEILNLQRSLADETFHHFDRHIDALSDGLGCRINEQEDRLTRHIGKLEDESEDLKYRVEYLAQ